MYFALNSLLTPIWFWPDTPETRLSKLWWWRLLSRRKTESGTAKPSTPSAASAANMESAESVAPAPVSARKSK